MIATARNAELRAIEAIDVERLQSSVSGRRPRIALYSHDTMGVGHMRRNLLIGSSLARSSLNARVLLVGGASEASMFAQHAGVDCLSLPALHKDQQGQYSSRNLQIGFDELIELRRHTIRAAIRAFQPDVFIVDKVPRGVANELDETLQDISSHRQTICILGLREILDEPEVVRREWEQSGFCEVVADCYRQVWVYGDAQVYNTVDAYAFPQEIAAKTVFTGYLDQCQRLTEAAKTPRDGAIERLWQPGTQRVACIVGGGQDGAALATAFCSAELAEGVSGVVLAGPCMPEEDRRSLQCLAERHGRIRYVDSMPEADALIHSADRVVAMGGYNTVCSVLSFNRPALIVPRVRPRVEQLIRASRLSELGLISMIHPDQLTSRSITNWIAAADNRSSASRAALDLSGLSRMPRMLLDLLLSARIHPPQKEFSSYVC